MSTILRAFAAATFVLTPAVLTAGTVTGIAAAPAKIAAGASTTLTVTGSNPCGAVHIIYGDGDAITHPITGLPSSHTHIYKQPGAYTIVAKGMGNCDGEASTTLTVTESQNVPQITGVDISPTPARTREPVLISVTGAGTCSFTIDFGDGNTQDASGRLPQQLRHTYPLAGLYAISVIAAPPCTGRRSTQVDVRGRSTGRPQLTGIAITPSSGVAGQPVTIRVHGEGTCSYTLDFGDGNSDDRTRELPDEVRHSYPAADVYLVAATAHAPCAGTVRARVRVRSSGGAGVTGVEATPSRANVNQPVRVTIIGEGRCRIMLDFDDGRPQTLDATLPTSVSHAYVAAATYRLRVRGEPPCFGEAGTRVEIR